MAKKNDKGYSTGNAKKWAVMMGIVVLIAVIVVVVILCIPPNTYNAVETLNRTTQTSFLSSESEKVSYDKFENKLSQSRVNYYVQEFADIQILAESLQEVLDFYNDYLLFAEDNKTLQENYKTIKNGLNDASQSQQKLVSIISEANKLSAESTSTYLQGAVIDFRREFMNWLNYYCSAINGLNNSFKGSMGNILENNSASQFILNTVDDYLAIIKQDFQDVVNYDKKGVMQEYDYKGVYKATVKIKGFSLYVDKYLSTSSNNSEIKTYYFNNDLITKYQKLNNFFTLYNETNLQKIINSMKLTSGEIEISFVYENVVDDSGVYDAIKIFVKGGE